MEFVASGELSGWGTEAGGSEPCTSSDPSRKYMAHSKGVTERSLKKEWHTEVWTGLSAQRRTVMGPPLG